MTITDTLQALDYHDSPNFLRADRGELDHVTDYGHVFRKAVKKPLSLHGVYALSDRPSDDEAPIVPAVYVCKANSEKEAEHIHRLVWNQNVVPFLLVHTPQGVRAYSGFRYAPDARTPAGRGIILAPLSETGLTSSITNEKAPHRGTPLDARS